jgi:hypothetical protein
MPFALVYRRFLGLGTCEDPVKKEHWLFSHSSPSRRNTCVTLDRLTPRKRASAARFSNWPEIEE